MKTPVLFIVFNRLETTQQVFASIREYKPDQLFIAADGPRVSKEGESEKCSRVREWIQASVDWDCEVKTLFQSDNLGCGKGPATAISWFFENVDEGIILEDDTVPHIDFFYFASELLERFRNDKEIMVINSSNFQIKKWDKGSYYFSMQNGPFCAWATWKRTWIFFDYTLDAYSENEIKDALKNYNVTKREIKWWLNIFRDVKNNIYNGSSWDYQLIFTLWINRGKSIVPNVNLSTNIGFGPNATHTTNADDITANRPTESILPLYHSSHTRICRKADLFYYDFYYDKFVEHISIMKKIKRFIKRKIQLLQQ